MARLGWRSLRMALFSIWRIRSRVTPKIWPTSSRVWVRSSYIPKRMRSTSFAIYHPALTYYARAYNIEQIAIEADGKEPSAKHIANIIDKAHDKAIRTLLYQVEYPRSVVDVVAKDMGIEPKEINPLASNPLQFIKDVSSGCPGLFSESFPPCSAFPLAEIVIISPLCSTV